MYLHIKHYNVCTIYPYRCPGEEISTILRIYRQITLYANSTPVTITYSVVVECTAEIPCSTDIDLNSIFLYIYFFSPVPLTALVVHALCVCVCNVHIYTHYIDPWYTLYMYTSARTRTHTVHIFCSRGLIQFFSSVLSFGRSNETVKTKERTTDFLYE